MNEEGDVGVGLGVGVGRVGLVVERFSGCSSGAAMLKICGAPALFKERRKEEARGLKPQKKKKKKNVLQKKCMQI